MSSADNFDGASPGQSRPARADVESDTDSERDGDTATIHGIALGNDDVIEPEFGDLRWRPEVVEQVSDSLEGRPLTDKHSDSPYHVIGEVTKTAYDPEKGILYEAELDEPQLAEKIDNGRLEVSPRISRVDEDMLAEDETGKADVAPTTEQVGAARHLAIVARGAAPSASAASGSRQAVSSLSVSDLVDAFGVDAITADADIPGGSGTDGDEFDADTVARAESAAGGREAAAAAAADATVASYIDMEYGIDATEYSDVAGLRDDIADARRSSGGTIGKAVSDAEAAASSERGPPTIDMGDSPDAPGERIAQSAARGVDFREATKADLSMTEHFSHQFDLDASEYDDEDTLRADLEDARGGGGR